MICLLLREADAFIMAIPRPRMHLRYAQPRIPVYLSRAKDISGFLAYRQPNHQFFSPAIRIHQQPDPVVGGLLLPTTLDSFDASQGVIVY
jgi:hypothetical protein